MARIAFTQDQLDRLQAKQSHLRVAAAERGAPTKVAPQPVAPAPGLGARQWAFTYQGRMVSMNATYAGLHWTRRNALKNKWRTIFLDLLAEAQMEPVAALRIQLRYNSKHDLDNLVLATKILCDSMKGRYIPDDTKQYYRGMSIEPDPALPHNVFVFTIHELLS